MQLITMVELAYGGVTALDASAKIFLLNKSYFNARKIKNNLVYRKFLTKESKQILNNITLGHIIAILKLLPYSFIPFYGPMITGNIINNLDKFYESYLEFFKDGVDYINVNEEEERQSVAEFLSYMYKENNDCLPEKYENHKLSDETIRISKKEMIKFLKKYKIYIKEKNNNEENVINYKIIYKDKKYNN